MPYSISSFKSEVMKKGLQRSHDYEFWVQAPISGGGAMRHFVFTTESISLPGASFVSVSNYRPYGSGRVWDVPYAFNPQEITATHMVDKNSDSLVFLHQWISSITSMPENGQNISFVSYFDDYKADSAEIRLYDSSTKELTVTYCLYEVFPTSIDQVQMGWANEEVAKVNVGYRFTDYEIKR
jgi:hypothetical protein